MKIKHYVVNRKIWLLKYIKFINILIYVYTIFDDLIIFYQYNMKNSASLEVKLIHIEYYIM